MYQTILVFAVISETYLVLHQDGDTAMSLAKSGEVLERLNWASIQHHKKGTTRTYKVSMFRIHSHVLENLLYVHNDRSPLWAW